MKRAVSRQDGPSATHKRLRTIATSDSASTDLWNKLPAEIRNIIYGLIIRRKAVSLHHLTGEKASDQSQPGSVDSAPVISVPGSCALFLVNKQFRREAGSLCFGISTVYVTVTASQISESCGLIKRTLSSFRLDKFGRLRLEIQQLCWHDLPDFKALADPVFASQLPKPVIQTAFFWRRRSAPFIVQTDRDWPNVARALQACTDVASDCRNEGLSRKEFNERYRSVVREIKSWKSFERSQKRQAERREIREEALLDEEDLRD